MDIIFVDAFQQSNTVNFPIGINLLSTIVNSSSNYTSEVISFPNLIAEKKVLESILLEKDYKTIVSYILNKAPKIVSFYSIGNSYFITLTVAKKIKEIDESIKIIFAGPHVSLCSQETIKSFDFIDMIAIGEGEQNIISILDYFNNMGEIENIKGVCYRKSNQIICNEPTTLLKNLDELPMIEFDKDTLTSRISIETGRGCPFNCTFCCTKTFWRRKVRLKSTDQIINEIKYYMNKYNIRKFDFIHDLFTASKDNILEFCCRIVDLGIEIEWTCSARADTLDEEIIILMARAGCKKILLGIETGSQRMQGVINKNLNMSQVKGTIRQLDRNNIEMQVNFIYGLPTEKKEDLIKSLDIIRFCVEEVLIQEVTIHKCMCFPSTHIYLNQSNDLILNEENFYLFKYPAKNQVDLIRSYPNLFSSLFILDSEIMDKYFYLDIFINYVYNYFAFKVPKAMKEIIKLHNNSLLDLYIEYETETKKASSLLTRTVYYGDKLNDVREEMSKDFENFIKNRIKDDFIVDLCRFETEVMKTLSSENSDVPNVHTFDYDMLLYYQELKRKRQKCELAFSVNDNKEVNIYKKS